MLSNHQKENVNQGLVPPEIFHPPLLSVSFPLSHSDPTFLSSDPKIASHSI